MGIKIEGTAVMGAVSAAVNRNAAPAQLVTLEEAARITQEVPEQASTTREDMHQQIIGDALSRRLASAPPVAAARITQEVPQQASITREDMRQQIIGDALSRRLASAPPAAAAALQRAMMPQGQNPTLLQNHQQVVEGVPVPSAPCKESQACTAPL